MAATPVRSNVTVQVVQEKLYDINIVVTQNELSLSFESGGTPTQEQLITFGQYFKGDNGKSAYEIWLDQGYTGTEEDFLEWLKADVVQSDWNQNDSTAPDFIKGKPENIVQDADYVHTDNNYTTEEKEKLAGIEVGAQANVQTDWEETDDTDDAFLKNMPDVFRNLPDIPDIPDVIVDGTIIERIVQDYDGNWYDGVVIGEQIWLTCNLKTKHYIDGVPITYGDNNLSTSTAYYYYPDNNQETIETYGLLYNYKVIDESVTHKLFQKDWSIPSYDDFVQLKDYVGSVAANQNPDGSSWSEQHPEYYIAKSLCSKHYWNSIDRQGCPGFEQQTNNNTGFNATPSGTTYSTVDATISYFGELAAFWSNTPGVPNGAGPWCLLISYNEAQAPLYMRNSVFATSIRCVCNMSASDWFAENKSRLYLKVTSNGMVWSKISEVAETGSYDDLTDKPTIPDISGKADKVTNATSGNFAGLDNNGNLIDSGSKAGDFQTVIDATHKLSADYIEDGTTNKVINVQSDWNENDSSSDAYIKNKPTIYTVRTMNGEQLTDSSLGDINIHDGFYFPNAVQDYDGNWYGAVVIGNQVWLGENLRTTHYSDGVGIPITNIDRRTSIAYGFVNKDETNTNEYGLVYNWYAVVRGIEGSSTPIQGLAPVGWHIPTQGEFENFALYLRHQKRYISDPNNQNSVSKSVASTYLWNQSSNNYTPGYNQEKNNLSGFNAKPAGYGYYSYNQQGGYVYYYNSLGYITRFWTSVKSNANDAYGKIISYGEKDKPSYNTGEQYNTTQLFSVRCISDLTPIQFRDWYIKQYGSLQHHLPDTFDLENFNNTDWNYVFNL